MARDSLTSRLDTLTVPRRPASTQAAPMEYVSRVAEEKAATPFSAPIPESDAAGPPAGAGIPAGYRAPMFFAAAVFCVFAGGLISALTTGGENGDGANLAGAHKTSKPQQPAGGRIDSADSPDEVDADENQSPQTPPPDRIAGPLRAQRTGLTREFRKPLDPLVSPFATEPPPRGLHFEETAWDVALTRVAAKLGLTLRMGAAPTGVVSWTIPDSNTTEQTVARLDAMLRDRKWTARVEEQYLIVAPVSPASTGSIGPQIESEPVDADAGERVEMGAPVLFPAPGLTADEPPMEDRTPEQSQPIENSTNDSEGPLPVIEAAPNPAATLQSVPPNPSAEVGAEASDAWKIAVSEGERARALVGDVRNDLESVRNILKQARAKTETAQRCTTTWGVFEDRPTIFREQIALLEPVLATDSGASQKSSAAAQSYAFNVRNVDWGVVLEAFSDDAGLNLEARALPTGALTCTHPGPYTLDEAVGVLNQHLAENGFLAERNGQTLRLERIRGRNHVDARLSVPPPPVIDDGRDQGAATTASHQSGPLPVIVPGDPEKLRGGSKLPRVTHGAPTIRPR